jgi:hypothetical protein
MKQMLVTDLSALDLPVEVVNKDTGAAAMHVILDVVAQELGARKREVFRFILTPELAAKMQAHCGTVLRQIANPSAAGPVH